MLVTSVSPAAHMHRRAARSGVAAALLRAGSIAVALLRAGSVAVALLLAGSIAVALLRAARALSVQKRYANEWDVQKRHGSEQGGGPCGARGVSAASGTARRGERHGEGNGAASRTAQRGGAAQRNVAYRQRKAPACGDTRAPGERVRGHDAPD